MRTSEITNKDVEKILKKLFKNVQGTLIHNTTVNETMKWELYKINNAPHLNIESGDFYIRNGWLNGKFLYRDINEDFKAVYIEAICISETAPDYDYGVISKIEYFEKIYKLEEEDIKKLGIIE